MADIDPEFERCRSHERFELSRLEPRLGTQPFVLRQAAVVRRHGIFAKPLAQLTRDALGHPAGVDEHQRRAMRLNQPRQPIVVLLPHFVRHHRFEGGARNLEIEIDGSAMALVHDRAIGEAGAVDAVGAHQKPCDFLDGPLRGRKADPNERRGDHLLQTFQAESQCAPRRVPNTAWISSTITVRTVRSIARLRSAVRSRYRDSGVVTRMCGGVRNIAARSVCGVSPVRTAAVSRGASRPSASATRRRPRRGSDRFLWMSALRALSGDT